MITETFLRDLRDTWTSLPRPKSAVELFATVRADLELVYEAELGIGAEQAAVDALAARWDDIEAVLEVLKDAGANVRLAILPLVYMNDVSIDEAITYEGRDQGPDDFLGRHGESGPAKLKEIIDTNIPTDPVDRAKLVMKTGEISEKQKAVVELLGDLTFVAALHVGGHIVVDQVTAIVAKSGIKKRSIQEAVKKLQERLSDVTQDDAADSLDLPYVIERERGERPRSDARAHDDEATRSEEAPVEHPSRSGEGASRNQEHLRRTRAVLDECRSRVHQRVPEGGLAPRTAPTGGLTPPQAAVQIATSMTLQAGTLGAPG